MKKTFITSLFLNFLVTGFLQAQFITKGKIEFEKKTNVHRLYFNDNEGISFMEEIKKKIPQFSTDYFDLIFSGDRSLYKPGKESDVKKSSFFESAGSANTVYKDLNKEIAISQKQVFESNFLINDSVKKFEWKLLSETRTIAGFECRKAVGRICDSVVVVAFYTDEIIPANGPESFNGLPGMILGLAIPRLYTTWFATKLELISDADEAKINPPSKGKKSNQKDLIAKINDGIKDWGEKYRDRTFWMVTL